jgi:hypothetical protein
MLFDLIDSVVLLQELEDARAINAQQRHGFAEAQAKHGELHAELQQKEASLATCQVRLGCTIVLITTNSWPQQNAA